MANFNWKTGASGDWNLAADWTEGLIPNDAAAAVTIPFVAGPGYTVTIAAGAIDTIQTIDLNSNLVVNGTLIFAPGSTGDLGHDYEGSVVTMTNGTIVNAGLTYAHVDTFGIVQFKGANPVYLAYELQVHDGTTTLDTASIGLLKGTQLFDGIFEVMGAGRVFNFGGAGGGLKVDVESLTGPKATITPNFFSQLIYDNAGSQINEWNGTAYVPVESTLKLIDNAAFVTVTGGRDYTTAGPLTIGKDGMFEQAGGTLTTGGLALLAGGVFSGGISITGSASSVGQVIVKGAVANNGQIVSGGPGIVFRDGLSGTGEITFNRTVPLPGWLHGEVVAAVPGILEVNGVGAGQTIKMIGDDTLTIDNFATFNGIITTTGTGNALVLTGIARAAATFVVGSNGAVALTIGGKTLQAGNVQQLRFSDVTVNTGAVSGDPVVSSPTLLVAENAAAAAVKIAAPTDPNYTTAQLVITATALPNDGSLTLASGTAVAVGQVLTAADLTGLLFAPTAGMFGVSSAFTYTVADPSGRASTGTATLAIGPALPASPAGEFDAAYYLLQNPDVAAAKVDPLAHYNENGWREGRNPDALFNTSYYLNQNPDVAAADINPLTHYQISGWQDGRDPSADFSTSAYLKANPDVAAAHIDPLKHYIDAGRTEGRLAFIAQPHGVGEQDALVDNTYYFSHYADVRASGINPFTQYDAAGWHELKNPDALFDTSYYLEHNLDVKAAAIDPLLHYEQSGWKEGRDPSAQFSTSKYLAANADVKAAGINPLVHYLGSGSQEGRAIFNA